METLHKRVGMGKRGWGNWGWRNGGQKGGMRVWSEGAGVGYGVVTVGWWCGVGLWGVVWCGVVGCGGVG